MFDTWLPYATTTLRKSPHSGTAVMLGTATIEVEKTIRIIFIGSQFCGDENLLPESKANVRAAIGALLNVGLSLGEIIVTIDGSVIAVDAIPTVVETQTIRLLSPELLKVLNEPLNRW